MSRGRSVCGLRMSSVSCQMQLSPLCASCHKSCRKTVPVVGSWIGPTGTAVTFNVPHAALRTWLTLSCACITGEEYLTNAAGEQLPDSGDAGDPAVAAEPVGLSEEYPSEAREALDDAGLEGARFISTVSAILHFPMI